MRYLSIVVILLTIVGCASTPPRPVQSGFEDIPVPKGLEFKADRSTIIESPSVKAARQVYAGRVEPESLGTAFRTTLEANGWRPTRPRSWSGGVGCTSCWGGRPPAPSPPPVLRPLADLSAPPRIPLSPRGERGALRVGEAGGGGTVHDPVERATLGPHHGGRRRVRRLAPQSRPEPLGLVAATDQEEDGGGAVQHRKRQRDAVALDGLHIDGHREARDFPEGRGVRGERGRGAVGPPARRGG